MEWLINLFIHTSSAHSILLLSCAIVAGLSLGKVKIYKISIGVGGVLFAGLLIGHLHLPMDENIVDFARELGLALFVFSIGLQVGPSFFSSFGKKSLYLNLAASAIVLIGVGIAVLMYFILNLPVELMIGILTGAVTNTPSLGAAQQALGSPEAIASSGLAYAMAYPFGVFGIIIVILLIRFIFKININDEIKALQLENNSGSDIILGFDIRVLYKNMDGRTVADINELIKEQFVISRIMRNKNVEVAVPQSKIEIGDVLHVVCSKKIAENLAGLLGEFYKKSVTDLLSEITVRQLTVTNKSIVGHKIEELSLVYSNNVTITRVNRGSVEFVAYPETVLHFGDVLTLVGEEDNINKVTKEIGDSLKAITHPDAIPLFIGLILGVILGSIPFFIPGVPAPIKLGLAGGPLIVALILGRLGKTGPIIWYLPESANLILREIGIGLFLTSVGIKSGGKFVETFINGGLYWMLLGIIITVVPLLAVAIFVRIKYKMNYLVICGLLSGSMTDPPALSFATGITNSDVPIISYANVYPLVMFLRIVLAQIFVILLLNS